MMLFAQIGAPAGRAGGGANGADTAFIVGMFIFLGICVAIGLGIQCFFLWTLSKVLKQCSPRNRTMEPGMVWLNLIPCVNVVWQIITVLRITESLEEEYYDRRLRPSDPEHGKTVGMVWSIGAILGVIPYLGVIASLASFICFIIYWVKMWNIKKELQADAEDQRYGREDDPRDDDDRYDDDRYDDYEDEFDDRPKRRRRR